MPEISTLFFIYGIDNFFREEALKIESEFAKELKLLDEVKANPDETVVRLLIKKSKEVCP